MVSRQARFTEIRDVGEAAIAVRAEIGNGPVVGERSRRAGPLLAYAPALAAEVKARWLVDGGDHRRQSRGTSDRRIFAELHARAPDIFGMHFSANAIRPSCGGGSEEGMPSKSETASLRQGRSASGPSRKRAADADGEQFAALVERAPGVWSACCFRWYPSGPRPPRRALSLCVGGTGQVQVHNSLIKAGGRKSAASSPVPRVIYLSMIQSV